MDLHFNFDEQVAIYGRRMSTGKPTRTHIINEIDGKSFCGYDDFCAEVSIVDTDEIMFKPDFCKKCFNVYKKINNKIK